VLHLEKPECKCCAGILKRVLKKPSTTTQSDLWDRSVQRLWWMGRLVGERSGPSVLKGTIYDAWSVLVVWTSWCYSVDHSIQRTFKNTFMSKCWKWHKTLCLWQRTI